MRIEGIKKMLCTSVIFVIFTGALFADDGNSFFSIFAGKKIDMQMIYDNMSELVPIVGYMRPEYTTDIDLEFATAVDSEIKNQMIMTSTFKPVSMVKWLTSKYGQNKASSIFDFIKELNEERYPVNVMGIYKPYIYKVGNEIVIKISVFPFSKGGYPISAVRIVKSEKEMKEAIPYLLSDLSKLLKVQNEQFAKLAVEPFKINCRTLIEQRTGEFDFITTSFSNQEGVEIKSTDDYFSELFSYQAQCTGLFAATTTFFFATIKRRPSTIKSRTIIIITKKKENFRLLVKLTKFKAKNTIIELISILSAIGSKNLPKSVTN